MGRIVTISNKPTRDCTLSQGWDDRCIPEVTGIIRGGHYGSTGSPSPSHPTAPTVGKKKRRNPLKPGKTVAREIKTRGATARWYRYMNNVISRRFPRKNVFPAQIFRDVSFFATRKNLGTKENPTWRWELAILRGL